MKPTVLYVMASWSGARESTTFDDTYVERHLNQIKTLKHNLTQISIGNPANDSKRQEFEEYISSLKGVVVHNIPNIGRSYGQWARIYEKYRTQFDYYIFVEDDYQPVIDNFDSILIDMYEQQKCGFLCGLVLNQTGRYGIRCQQEHAGITNGIASSAALEKVRDLFCCIPHDMGEYSNGQLLFSKGFLDAGLKLGEYIASGEYRALYYQHNEQIRIYGPKKDAKDIFSPAQVVGKDNFQSIHITEATRPISLIQKKRSIIGRR